MKKKDKIAELNNQITELKAGWQRTQADFDNFCRRSDKDRAELIKFANLELLAKLFPIMDNFRRAGTHLPQNLNDNDWAKGIMMIEKQLQSILADAGLEKVEPKTGEEFNPQSQEAISCEGNKQFKANQIIGLVEVGYKIGDKIVRTAKVRVAK